MKEPDPPSVTVTINDNINTEDKTFSPIIPKSIQDITQNLTPDERRMIEKGVLPSQIQEKFEGLKKTDILSKIYEFVNRRVIISKDDRIEALIHNGKDGFIKIKRTFTENGKDIESVREIFRYNGYLGPVLKIDQKIPGIKFQTPWDEMKFSIADFLTFARSMYSLTTAQLQSLKLVLDAFVTEEDSNGNVEDFLTSPINVFNDMIQVDFPDLNNAESLKKLRDFYEITTNRRAYLLTLGWSVIAPFHYVLKSKATGIIQAPLLVFTGRTKGGKTALASFFVGRGFNQSKDGYFFGNEAIRKIFTFMKHMSETNLPAVLDDVPASFNSDHRYALKSYVQTGNFGDRGHGDQTLTQYKGARSFIETLNEDIMLDEDLAFNNRIIQEKYTKDSAEKKNLAQWNDFINSIPSGFMISIVKELFNGQNIDDILREVETFDNGIQWINFGLNKLNTLCNKYGIPPFPSYDRTSEKDFNTYAVEISQAFIAEDQRIKTSEEEYWEDDGDGGERATKKVKYRSKIEGEFKVEEKQDSEGKTRYFIYFTGGAFKTLTSAQFLKVPYRNATEFLNNIESSDEGVRVEFDGKLISKKIGDMPLKVFCISIPEFEGGEE